MLAIICHQTFGQRFCSIDPNAVEGHRGGGEVEHGGDVLEGVLHFRYLGAE